MTRHVHVARNAHGAVCACQRFPGACLPTQPCGGGHVMSVRELPPARLDGSSSPRQDPLAGRTVCNRRLDSRSTTALGRDRHPRTSSAATGTGHAQPRSVILRTTARSSRAARDVPEGSRFAPGGDGPLPRPRTVASWAAGRSAASVCRGDIKAAERVEVRGARNAARTLPFLGGATTVEGTFPRRQSAPSKYKLGLPAPGQRVQTLRDELTLSCRSEKLADRSDVRGGSARSSDELSHAGACRHRCSCLPPLVVIWPLVPW